MGNGFEGCYLMCMSVFPTYMCILCVISAQRGQKRALVPLELDLWMVPSHHVGAGN